MKQYFVKFSFTLLIDGNSALHETIIFNYPIDKYFLLKDIENYVRDEMVKKYQTLLKIRGAIGAGIYNVKIIDLLPL
jgi:hypothetical protein